MIEQAVRIGTFFGIPVRIHWTFLLIFAYILFTGLSEGHSMQMILVEMVFMLCMFVCVVLHEFGHALTARRYKIRTEDIILLPIGGVARLRNMPAKPVQELWVAIMGPMVNLVIAILLFTFLMFKNGWNQWVSQVDAEGLVMNWQNFLFILMVANLGLLVFNMIPAFPMDGGRVLRAFLAMWLGRLNATKWATRIGQIICVVLILTGVYYGAWTLALIGLFIFLSAGQEYRSVVVEDRIQNKSLAMCARKINDHLLEYQTAEEAMQTLISTGQSSFLVTDLEGRTMGYTTAARIVQSVKQSPQTRIRDITTTEYGILQGHTPLTVVIQYFRTHQPFVVVHNENGEPTHYADPEVVENFLRLTERA